MSGQPLPGQPQSSRGGSGIVRTVLPFAVFLFFLGLWTWELLAENPVPESVHRAIPNGWHFYLAKGLHVGAYAFLTVLAGLLPVNRYVFRGVIAILVLHGIASEIGQTFVPGRTGSVRDVLLDWLGLGLGLAFLGVVRVIVRSRRPALPAGYRPLPAGWERQ